MPAARYEPPSYPQGTEIVQLLKVRRALTVQALRIAPRARSLARSEGLDSAARSVHVKEGTRPKGRPYSYVIMDHEDGEKHEFGDTNTARRRILGRAGNA